jgi:hypothetical protein
VLKFDLRDSSLGLRTPVGAGAGRRLSAAPPAGDDLPGQESFGAGMRLAQHQVGDIEITPGEDGAGEIRAVAAITFPKRSRPRRGSHART